MIRENLKEVEERILAACRRSGRPRESVKLIAVSTTKPAGMIREAYDCGQRLFGENHAQEIVEKKPVLPADTVWHFIGNLQKNKVKYLVGQVALIHSVNSESLAAEIEKRAQKAGTVQDILLEVNIASEESKQGAAPDEIRALLRFCEAQPHIRVCGLMAVAPFSDDPEDSRPFFSDLRQMLNELKHEVKEPERFCELSMGMSGDFETAIEEGATLIRVGTAIFGSRMPI